MISPTVGRVVWFWPKLKQSGQQPQAAIVTHVWGEAMINIVWFTANGTPVGDTSVTLWQDDLPPPSNLQRFCEWMPYQKGQAAKTEALEKGFVPLGSARDTSDAIAIAAEARALGKTGY